MSMRESRNRVAIHGGKIWQLTDHQDDDTGAIINADVNNAFYPPAPRVVGAIKSHLMALNNLPDPSCRHLRGKLARLHSIEERSIEIGNGSSDLLQTIITGFVQQGQSVVMLSPTYSEYERCALSVGAEVRAVELEESNWFAPNTQSILGEIDEATRMVIICNPNNPTGQVIPKVDLFTLLQSIPRDVWVLIDEAYIDFSPANSMVNEAKRWGNLIVVRTFSKAYALAGLRIGYGVLGDRASRAFSTLVRPPWPVGFLSAKAAEAAIEEREYVEQMLTLTRDLTRELARQLSTLPGIKVFPSETNFFLINMKGTGQLTGHVVKMLEEQNILLRDCSSFGAVLQDQFIRVTTQSRTDNSRIIKALEAILE